MALNVRCVFHYVWLYVDTVSFSEKGFQFYAFPCRYAFQTLEFGFGFSVGYHGSGFLLFHKLPYLIAVVVYIQ